MAELFAYRVVLNGIVLARPIWQTLFTAYLTYRAFVGLHLPRLTAGRWCCARASSTPSSPRALSKTSCPALPA